MILYFLFTTKERMMSQYFCSLIFYINVNPSKYKCSFSLTTHFLQIAFQLGKDVIVFVPF